MKLAHAIFLDICFDADPEAHLRSRSDHDLRELLKFLRDHDQQRGIAGEVWAMCCAEATRRFLEGGRP